MSSKKWLENIAISHPKLDAALLAKAYQFVEKHGGDKKITYADSILSQGLTMADVLQKLNCDSQTIAAAILYPHFYHCPSSKETIIQQFGSTIHKLLRGAKQMEAIHALSNQIDYTLQKKQSDNIRKMLLAMVDDFRTVLIKLAERLAILKYLKFVPAAQQKLMAEQAMHLYAPLANRLGIGYLKWQMEDLAFRFLEPEIYQHISKSLRMRRQDRDEFIQSMKQQLTDLFIESKIENFSLSGRAKHIYSIYRKMQRKQVDFSEIYDTSAFRILVPTINDCYTALGVIHANWKHIAKEFDDYIAKPKPNGYRSIHTVIIAANHINVEIQIRTYKMHEEAELGVAAHWKYKENAITKSTYEDKINLLREVINWQQEVSTENGNQENHYADIFKDRIYVFTPNGDIFDMESGATPLDFAYHIHSEVGHRCKGAKVNGHLVPLTYTLHTGDQVQILTSKEDHPSRDWLNPNLGYLKSAHARSKVRHWFHKKDYTNHLARGQAIWEKASRREGLKKSQLNTILHDLNFKNVNDLIAAIGAGEIGIRSIINQLKEAPKKLQQSPTIIKNIIPKKKQLKESTGFDIEGIGNLITQLARCCQPIPGDPIVGYITKGRGVTIHQANCYNIKKITETRAERILQVSWGSESPQTYPVNLTIEADDRPGLIRDISNVIANENISVIGINSRVNKLDNLATIHLTIEIKHIESLSKLMKLLRQIPDVNRVNRL